MSRSQNLDRMTRYQWFESGSLQRRVRCELGRAWTQQAALRFDPRLSARSPCFHLSSSAIRRNRARLPTFQFEIVNCAFAH